MQAGENRHGPLLTYLVQQISGCCGSNEFGNWVIAIGMPLHEGEIASVQ